MKGAVVPAPSCAKLSAKARATCRVWLGRGSRARGRPFQYAYFHGHPAPPAADSYGTQQGCYHKVVDAFGLQLERLGVPWLLLQVQRATARAIQALSGGVGRARSRAGLASLLERREEAAITDEGETKMLFASAELWSQPGAAARSAG